MGLISYHFYDLSSTVQKFVQSLRFLSLLSSMPHLAYNSVFQGGTHCPPDGTSYRVNQLIADAREKMFRVKRSCRSKLTPTNKRRANRQIRDNGEWGLEKHAFRCNTPQNRSLLSTQCAAKNEKWDWFEGIFYPMHWLVNCCERRWKFGGKLIMTWSNQTTMYTIFQVVWMLYILRKLK